MTNWRRRNQPWDPLGLFAPREERGGVVQTDRGPRVQIRRPDGSTHLGHLDPTMDAPLNPAAIQQNYQEDKREKNEAKVEGLFEKRQQKDEARYQAGRTDALNAANRAQENYTASLNHTREQSARQFELLSGQLAAQIAQAAANNDTTRLQIEATRQGQKDSSEIAREGMVLNARNQKDALDLKRTELGLTSNLRSQELAIQSDQFEQKLKATRGAAKLDFIGRAAAALLA